MKLWLDDIRPAPDGWKAVTNWGDAIRILATGWVEEVSLDHDLGSDRDGYQVASFIEEAACFNRIPRLKWNVHSMNPVGRERITRCLERADLFWQENSVMAS